MKFVLPASPRLAAFAVLVLTLILTGCNQSGGPQAGDPPFTEAQEKRLRELFKEELANTQLPEGSLTDSRKLREEIDKLVLAKVEEQLANGALKDAVSSERVVKILQRVEKSGGRGSHELEAVDLSQFPTVEGKINRILEEFEGVNSYSSNNPLTKQLTDLGPQAKAELFKALRKQSENGGNNWSAKMALAEALKPMITVDDKDMLLEDLKSPDPQMGDVIRRLHVEEAGDYALSRIQELKADEYIHHEVIGIALDMREEEALPLLLKRLEAPKGNSAAWLASTLDQKFPDLDISPQLRIASSHLDSNRGPYEAATFAQLMLKRGMPEGLALAADALLANSSVMHGSDHYREQVRSTLRLHANVTGSDEEVAKWLLENRTKLRWNAELRMFE